MAKGHKVNVSLSSDIDIARYHKAVAYLEGLINAPRDAEYMKGKVRSDVYIKRLRYLLNLLGNPQKGMKYVHVAGTAGKGTVASMVANMLTSAGYKVGVDTSPFVTTSAEKIQVNGRYIAPGEFADIIDYLKPYLDIAHQDSPYGLPSYFEIFFTVAFIHFKRQKCDWVVLEAGLGGRYDASNVIEDPVITVVTNVDYDHTEILGKTLKKIAYDKAGIIKTGSTFFTTEQRPHLLKIFKQICKDKRVPLHPLTNAGSIRDTNAGLINAIGRQLGIGQRYIDKALNSTKLPARFEVMQKAPMVVLDGAHNRAKMRSTVANLKGLDYKKLHLIIALADNKDYDQVLGEIVPYADHIHLTRFSMNLRKCAPPNRLSPVVKRYSKHAVSIEIFLDPEQALMQAMKSVSKDDLVLITGSFFLAGELRQLWHTEEEILIKGNSF